MRMFEDVWYGDNRNGTGWTMQDISVIGTYEETKEQKTKTTPEGFIVPVAFKSQWEVKE